MDRVYVMQLVRSFRVGEISRRQFLKRATTAVGSAAALSLLAACATVPPNAPNAPVVVEPAADPTATSPAEADPAADPTAMPVQEIAAGMMAAGITYGQLGEQELTGYLARPQGDEPAPAIVVIQEWWGLNEHIKDVTRRFADEGFVALAPDLYHGVVTSEPDEARKQVMELDMMAAVQEIQAAVDYLLAQEYVSGEKAAIIGFCMGGRLVLQTGLVAENLSAIIPFYGTPLTAEEVANVKAPVLGLYGANDGGIPVDSVRIMQTALDAAGIENEIVVYDGAPHAFFNDTSASYRPEAAADAWARVLAWLQR